MGAVTNRYWSEENADREKDRERESAAVIPTINTGSTTTSATTVIGTSGTTTTTGPERRR